MVEKLNKMFCYVLEKKTYVDFISIIYIFIISFLCQYLFQNGLDIKYVNNFARFE